MTQRVSNRKSVCSWGLSISANDHRNRAAAVNVDFKFDAIHRSGSRDCQIASVWATNQLEPNKSRLLSERIAIRQFRRGPYLES